MTSGAPADVQATLLELIRRVSPRPLPDPIPLDVPLGANGLGLDSIARVELLAELDLALGVLLPVELIADGDAAPGDLLARLLAE